MDCKNIKLWQRKVIENHSLLIAAVFIVLTAYVIITGYFYLKSELSKQLNAVVENYKRINSKYQDALDLISEQIAENKTAIPIILRNSHLITYGDLDYQATSIEWVDYNASHILTAKGNTDLYAKNNSTYNSLVDGAWVKIGQDRLAKKKSIFSGNNSLSGAVILLVDISGLKYNLLSKDDNAFAELDLIDVGGHDDGKNLFRSQNVTAALLNGYNIKQKIKPLAVVHYFLMSLLKPIVGLLFLLLLSAITASFFKRKYSLYYNAKNKDKISALAHELEAKNKRIAELSADKNDLQLQVKANISAARGIDCFAKEFLQSIVYRAGNIFNKDMGEDYFSGSILTFPSKHAKKVTDILQEAIDFHAPSILENKIDISYSKSINTSVDASVAHSLKKIVLAVIKNLLDFSAVGAKINIVCHCCLKGIVKIEIVENNAFPFDDDSLPLKHDKEKKNKFSTIVEMGWNKICETGRCGNIEITREFVDKQKKIYILVHGVTSKDIYHQNNVHEIL